MVFKGRNESWSPLAVDPEALYRTYGPMVLRRCRRIIGDEDRALDAMHDTFVRVCRSQEVLDARAPSSLLFRMATNHCLNLLRAERRRPETRDGALLLRIATSGEAGGQVHARDLLTRLFGKTPASSQTIATLHLVDGLTLVEVADQVGLSVSGVRKRLRALRASLHELEEYT
jgi:RNA polymerase sigma factor (sigma-70 family)